MSIHKGDSRFWPGLAVLVTCAVLPSCADADGRFQDFQHRLKTNTASADAGAASASDAAADGSCVPPAPDSVSGPALLAIDTSLTGGSPILFLGIIDTPAAGSTTAVHFVYHALDSLDRSTRVGPELSVGPFPLDQGLLTAHIPDSTLDGNANPIVHGAPIDSEMTLSGHICGVRTFYCGTLTGSTSGLISGPFSGTFGITLLGGPDAVPDQPRFGCAAEDLAAPL